jgi:hypothetical protein
MRAENVSSYALALVHRLPWIFRLTVICLLCYCFDRGAGGKPLLIEDVYTHPNFYRGHDDATGFRTQSAI